MENGFWWNWWIYFENFWRDYILDSRLAKADLKLKFWEMNVYMYRKSIYHTKIN